jgi:PAS domain S-box-containing protein
VALAVTALTPEPSPRLLVGLDAAGLLEHVDAAVIATTLDGVILYANPYCEVLYGRAPAQLLGQPSGDFADPVPRDVIREIGAAILGGRSWEGDFQVRRADGSVVAVHAMDSPLFSPDGTVVGVVSLAFDVTERSEREEQLSRRFDVAQFLADASTILSSSLDYPESLQRLAEVSVPFLADLCLIDVAEGAAIRRMGAAHADPAKRALVDELRLRYPPDPFGAHPAARVIRGGAAEVRAEMPEDFLQATTRSDDHLRIVQALDFASYMCVPLTARGRTIGALTLVSSGSGRRFGPSDLVLAEDMARRAALALDNVRLLSERTHVARALQDSLLPPSLPDIAGIELAARYEPAGAGNDIGGDFYDVFEVAPDRWAVVIGDVSGKGPEAGAVSGLARHTIRAGVLREDVPSRVLRLLHEALDRDESAGERFCTVCLGMVTVGSRRQRRRPRARVAINLSCGGHPLPVILRRDGQLEVTDCRGTLLGITENVNLVDQQVTLERGDTVVFYTDGVTEAHAPGAPMLGEEGLLEIIRASRGLPPGAIADRIIQAATTRSAGEPRDDMALLLVQLHG